jgi:hypothetical protein
MKFNNDWLDLGSNFGVTSGVAIAHICIHLFAGVSHTTLRTRLQTHKHAFIITVQKASFLSAVYVSLIESSASAKIV